MIPLVLETILTTLVPLGKGKRRSKIFPWVDDQPTEDDLNHIMEQTNDKFDILKLKDSMIHDLRKGKATLVTKSGPYAKVLAIVYPDTVIPWDMFGAIFTAFGKPKGNMWRIVWFANRTKRHLPSMLHEPGPEHVNGGYTFPCNTQTIVIYREEEVCRVLVHELLHAACTDNPSLDIIDQEAATETWAELFLVAICARGNRTKAAELWKKQMQWISDQEYVLRTNHNVNTRNSYAWRYTVARRHVLEDLKIELPIQSANPKGVVGNSMRFTHAGV